MDKTAQKALRMLELFCASSSPRGVSELARELSLPKSNVHRLLTTLEEEGYLRRTPEKSYVLTFKLWQLGAAMMSRVDVTTIAPQHMQWLVKETGESALLAVLDGYDVVYIHKVESEQAIQATTKIGSRIPAYCVGTGKAMLAAQTDEFIAGLSTHAYTPATVHKPKELAEQLRLVRERGYAVNRGEFRLGVCGIGAAILDNEGHCVAGVGVWGPDERFARQLDRLGAHVMRCAKDISCDLGYVEPKPLPAISRSKKTKG